MNKPFYAAALMGLAAMPLTANEADALQQRLAALSQFSAEFEQQAFDFDGQLVQESQGLIALQAPLRFAWEQSEPEPLTLVSDGEAVWYFDPFVEQVTVTPVEQALAQTPLALISSQDSALWAQWQVSKVDGCYQLVQKEQPEITMGICFSGEAIESLTLTDAQGTKTVMSLKAFSDQPVAAERFVFEPADGVFIDDQR
ncbi:outer membrane lipoprotein chaperone LolA [Ferrimonas marina]|uniref:Outer-membrane lipoprotein carrier protein n=1 Tax=Ferrimonas marina TaxID=299255 RepID=A0A1M5N4B9_9GAMM|nr:outer membrane lipoprotein chaperone LolA [Ferrimonas marina]SHG84371.1 outer membrane lipoprotein carrier protein [Ferrimonas marina]